MRKFENFNPYVLLIFFMCNLIPAMFLMEIKLNLLLLISGIIYIWILRGKADLKIIRNSVVITLFITFVNMLVSHSGSHIFFYLNNRAVTYEAMRYGVTTGFMLSGAFVWFSCMDIVITGEKIQYIFRKMPKAGIIFSMILRFLPMYMRKYERMKMINDINNKNGGSGRNNAIFVFSGVTSYAMESSMETADIMESNGFTQSSQIFCGSYRFRLRDIVLLLVTLLMSAGGILLPESRLAFMAFMSFIPILYRGKENVKLWIYNMKR